MNNTNATTSKDQNLKCKGGGGRSGNKNDLSKPASIYPHTNINLSTHQQLFILCIGIIYLNQNLFILTRRSIYFVVKELIKVKIFFWLHSEVFLISSNVAAVKVIWSVFTDNRA